LAEELRPAQVPDHQVEQHPDQSQAVVPDLARGAVPVAGLAGNLVPSARSVTSLICIRVSQIQLISTLDLKFPTHSSPLFLVPLEGRAG